jgi:hypothetical protein
MNELNALVRRLLSDGALLRSAPRDPCSGCPDFVFVTTRLIHAGTTYWLPDEGTGHDAERVGRVWALVRDLSSSATRAAMEQQFRATDHFALGTTWVVWEDVRDDDAKMLGVIKSVWTRRGTSKVFDSAWENTVTGERGADVIELVSAGMNHATMGQVVLEGRSSLRRYSGNYEVTSDHHVSGSVFGGRGWSAEILDAPPAAGAPLPIPDRAAASFDRPRPPLPLAAPPLPALLDPPVGAPAQTAAGTLNDAVAVSSGAMGACAVRVDGSIVCWGSAGAAPALLGERPAKQPGTPSAIALPGGARASDVAVGAGFACALAQDHSVWCWGNNRSGTLGNGKVDGDPHPAPRPLTATDGSPLRAVSIGAADDRACALTDDGVVLCWGRRYGANGAGNDLTPTRRLARRFDPRTARVRVGDSFACASDERDAACWGRNYAGQLASSDPEATVTEDVGSRLVGAGAKLPLRALTVGGAHACVVDGAGAPWCWGANAGLQVGNDHVPGANPRAVRLLSFPTSSITQVVAQEGQTCAIAGPSSAIFCASGRAFRRAAGVAAISGPSGGSLTGALRASLLGPYKCAIASYPGAPSGAGEVLCWGFWLGDPIVAGGCAPNQNVAACTQAAAVVAPALPAPP